MEDSHFLLRLNSSERFSYLSSSLKSPRGGNRNCSGHRGIGVSLPAAYHLRDTPAVDAFLYLV